MVLPGGSAREARDPRRGMRERMREAIVTPLEAAASELPYKTC